MSCENELSPEGSKHRHQALEDCSVLLDLILKGKMAAAAGDLVECDRLAHQTFEFTTSLEGWRASGVMFELTDQVIHELADKFGGVAALADALMKDEPVFARERSVADEESAEADHDH